jgi:hypothetical protein
MLTLQRHPHPNLPAGELPDDSKVTVGAGPQGLTFDVKPDEAAAAARAAEASRRSSFKKFKLADDADEDDLDEEMED